MSTSDVLDTLLRLGQQIEDAAEADDWSRVSELVERRSEAAQQLREVEPEGQERTEKNRKKLKAVADQNESLGTFFRGRRDEIEEELAQIGDLKRAQSSYRKNSSQGGVLPPELTG